MGNATYTPQIAFAKGFIPSVMELPHSAITKALSFVEKFQKNPQSTGINLEKVSNSFDKKMYSARIDKRYRAIIAHDTDSNVYLMLYAGDHENAYQWAVNKHVEVNSHTSAIQLYDHVTEEELKQGRPLQSWGPNTQSGTVREDHPLPQDYLTLDEDKMLELGVPEIYVPIMLEQRTVAGFDQWARRLPEDARASLQLIVEGQSQSDVLSMVRDSRETSPMLGLEKLIPAASAEVSSQQEGSREESTQNTPTFRDALASFGSQQSFVVVQGERDLKRLLDSPLDQWRVFLHPSQRLFVEHNYHGPFRLLGGAGTGKTVVAMHRAKRLAARLLKAGSSQKVLFTTYSTNLATDIRSNLRLICTPEEMNRIDVINLDKYVRRFLRDKGYDYSIWYDNNRINDVWDEAIHTAGSDDARGLSRAFFKAEWQQVIIPQQLSSLGEYLRAVRRGRGKRLARAQKTAVWRITERYQQLMKDERACDIDMAMSMVASLLQASDAPKRYAHVIVDEGQDFSAPAYRILRAVVDEHDNDLFIVGDAQQRIYGRTVVLSKCGINISGRGRRLRINYRTTEEIRAAAERVFASSGSNVADSVFAAVSGEPLTDEQPELFDDLNGQTAPSNDSRSLVNGPEPIVKRFATKSEEKEFAEQWIAELCGDPSASVASDGGSDDDSDGANARTEARDICVVARSNSLVEEWRDALDAALPYGVYQLKNDTEDDRQQPGIRLATMHRVKGLEFDYVIVVDVEDSTCPPRAAVEGHADNTALRDIYKQERSLIYVALTRARKGAMLLGR